MFQHKNYDLSGMEHFILFHFQVEMNRKFRLHHLYIQERAGTSTYIDTRTVFLSKYLKKGNYVLVPTMFQHGRTSEFLLRIFSEVPVQLRFSFLDQPCKLPFSALPPILITLALSPYADTERDNISTSNLTEMMVVEIFLKVGL